MTDAGGLAVDNARLYLLLSRPPPSAVKATREHRSPFMPTILIVEDNEMNRDMLARRLRRRGYDVLLAVDGADGVATTRAARPDLVLMDLGLPVLDGWQATREIKADVETSGIPVVALTAHAMSGDESRAREAGCDAFDTKPVNLERLVGTIESLLAGQRGATGTT